jgi:hypothetical protein
VQIWAFVPNKKTRIKKAVICKITAGNLESFEQYSLKNFCSTQYMDSVLANMKLLCELNMFNLNIQSREVNIHWDARCKSLHMYIRQSIMTIMRQWTEVWWMVGMSALEASTSIIIAVFPSSPLMYVYQPKALSINNITIELSLETLQ